MPIYRSGEWLHPQSRPDWCEVTSFGRFELRPGEARFDRHFHDDHEVWFVCEGKAKILVDGREQYVQSGDMVLTRAGDVHDVLEVYETLRGFFIETGHPPGGRAGHLHTDETDAAGHDIGPLPVPADFPPA